MKSTPIAKIFRSKSFCWRGLLVLLALLVIAFFFLSRSRGQSEWERYQKAVAAKGEHLDWAYFIPPAVTDSENFYAAPEMKQMFQRLSNGLGVTATPTPRPSKYSWSLPIDRKWNELKGKEEFVTSPNTISYPVSVVLRWENENTELLQIFYTACQRPKARLLTDYSHSFVNDVPNFVNIRGAAQALGTLARAHIISGHPEKALHDLDGIQRLIDALENGPTLVEAMVRVAVIGLYVDTVRFGFEKKAWNDEQLRALSRSLAKDRCVASVAHALRAETAGVVNWVDQERVPFYKMFPTSPRSTGTWKDWVEKGKAAMQGIQFACTRERNLLNYSQMMLDYARCVDAKGERIYPKESAAHTARLSSMTPSAANLLACIAIPNFTKAFETSAKNQTLADQAMLACGLERFHHANGHYPETLQELLPQYISKVPKDIITGDALKYRRTASDSFLLYGVGLDEKDDGGVAALDWVWNVSGEK